MPVPGTQVRCADFEFYDRAGFESLRAGTHFLSHKKGHGS